MSEGRAAEAKALEAPAKSAPQKAAVTGAEAKAVPEVSLKTSASNSTATQKSPALYFDTDRYRLATPYTRI